MQRDTTEYNIQRANELSKLIDAATVRPTDLLREFNRCVAWLAKYSPRPLDETVRYPENW